MVIYYDANPIRIVLDSERNVILAGNSARVVAYNQERQRAQMIEEQQKKEQDGEQISDEG